MRLRSTVGQLAKHSVIYGLASVLNKLIGFLLLPIYTRVFTPADYGLVALLGVTGTVAGILTQAGMGSALFREVIYEEEDEHHVGSTALFFLLIESGCVYGVLALAAPAISKLILDSAEYANLLRLIFLAGFLGTFKIVTMSRLRIHQRSGTYATLSCVGLLVSIALKIYFIVMLGRGVRGLVEADVLAAMFIAAMNLYWIAPYLRPRWSSTILRRMLTFGIPLIPVNIAALVMTASDRYFLKHYSSLAEVGLYAVGYNIALAVMLVVQAVQTAWPAIMFDVAKKEGAARLFSQMLTYYTAATAFVALGLSVFAEDVLRVMATPRFVEAYRIVPIISLGYVLYGMRYMVNSGLMVKNRNRIDVLVIGAGAVMNLILNFFLIPGYGMMGAAWATTMSYLFLLIAAAVVNGRLWPVRYEYGRLVRVGAAWLIIIATVWMLPPLELGWRLGVKLGLVMTFPVLLVALGFFKPEELVYTRRAILWFAHGAPSVSETVAGADKQ